MALREYLTLAEIEHTKIKDVAIQSNVDKVNTWYENLALSKGIDPAQIAFPLNPIALDLLISKVSRNISENNIGINPRQRGRAQGQFSDQYQILFTHYNKEYNNFLQKTTAEIIEGETSDPLDFVGGSVQVWRG